MMSSGNDFLGCALERHCAPIASYAERAVNRQPGDRPGTLRADKIFIVIRIHYCEIIIRFFFMYVILHNVL